MQLPRHFPDDGCLGTILCSLVDRMAVYVLTSHLYLCLFLTREATSQTYIPHIATVIHEENLALASGKGNPGAIHIKLESMMVSNPYSVRHFRHCDVSWMAVTYWLRTRTVWRTIDGLYNSAVIIQTCIMRLPANISSPYFRSVSKLYSLHMRIPPLKIASTQGSCATRRSSDNCRAGPTKMSINVYV